MRATVRLRDDRVHQSVVQVGFGGQGECGGGRGVGLLVGLLPQDGGAAFGADDRIPAVLQHGHAITHADAKRATAAALADHGADDRRAQAAHLAQVHGDGLGLAALLAVEARVGTRRVDERDDGQAELLGQLHLQHGLAITLGIGAAKAALDALLGGAALVMAHHQTLHASDAREAGDDTGIVAVASVAVQLAPVAADHADVVERLRALRMARHAHGLPRGQVGVGLGEQAVARVLQRGDLVGELDRVGLLLQGVDLPLDLGDRLLEVQGDKRWGGHEVNRIAAKPADPTTSPCRRLAGVPVTMST